MRHMIFQLKDICMFGTVGAVAKRLDLCARGCDFDHRMKPIFVWATYNCSEF